MDTENIDRCPDCGQRVKDFDPQGYERPDGQRGHTRCPSTPPDEPVYALWNGGTNYTPAYLAADVEKFDTREDALDAARERITSNGRRKVHFAYVGQEPWDCYVPCVTGSYVDLFYADDPRESDDPYPDERWEQNEDDDLVRVDQ